MMGRCILPVRISIKNIIKYNLHYWQLTVLPTEMYILTCKLPLPTSLHHPLSLSGDSVASFLIIAKQNEYLS